MPEPRPWNPCSLPGSKPLPPGGEAIDSLSASPAAQATPAADAEFGTIDRDFGMARGARRRAMTTLPADPTSPAPLEAFQLFSGHYRAPAPLAEARHWALLLDVDGTLIAHRPRPDQVATTPALVQLLNRLERHLGGALALVSGRSVAMLEQLFPNHARLHLVGLHGAEWRRVGQPLQQLEINPRTLAEVRSAMAELADSSPGTLLEDKGLSLALHWRQVPGMAEALRRSLDTIAATTGYVLQPGKFVYELKPRGADKGRALQQLMQHPPLAGRRPLYLGDDATDEPALAAALELGGLAIAVGEPRGEAPWLLHDVSAVCNWLSQLEQAWIQAT